MNGRDVSAINHSRDLRAAKNEEARVSVRIMHIRACARRAGLGAIKKFSMMKHPCESGNGSQNKHLDDSGRLVDMHRSIGSRRRKCVHLRSR